MTATSWPAARDFVWRPENDGQRVHVDAGDPGGETNMGVTAATWAAAVAHGYVTGALADATNAQLETVLRVLFWNVIKGDSLPKGDDLALFNFAMMAGTGRAAKVLQVLVGVTPDMVIGPQTLQAVWGQKPNALIAALTDRVESYFAACADAPQFLRGWDRRAADCRALALQLAGAPAVGG